MRYEFNKDKLGKCLIIFSFFMLIMMIYIAIRYPFLSVDEWFTKGLIKYPVDQLIQLTIIDVHPPLYYLILKAVIKILTTLHIAYDTVIVITLISIIPYIITLILSFTVIRKAYDWLTAGFFAFTLIFMSNFFLQFLTARMYSWGLLFILLGFLCVRPILEENNIKYWILLSICAVLGAYTHYFVAIAFVAMYIILFVSQILLNKENKKDSIKNWLISVVVGIILYVPWLSALFGQLSKVHSNYGIPPMTSGDIIGYFNILFTTSDYSVLGIIVMIAILIFTLVYYRQYCDNNQESRYLSIGLITILLTMIIAIVVSLTFKPIIRPRYLVPVSVLLWFAISVMIPKFDFKKVVIPILILFLIVGAVNIGEEMGTVYSEHERTVMDLNNLSQINNNNSIVVFDGMQKFVRFNDYLNQTDKYYVYSVNGQNHTPKYVKVLDLKKTQFDIPKGIDKYENKTLYYIVDHKNGIDNAEGYQVNNVTKIQNTMIYSVTPK